MRALGYSSEEILDRFFDTDTFHIHDENIVMDLVPDRLRGEVATFDIKDDEGNVIIEEGRRVTGRHIRQIQKTKLTQFSVPEEYFLGRSLAKDIIDAETGEVLLECNTEITEEALEKLRAEKIQDVEVLYSNELDCGSYISDTLRTDITRDQLEALVEIYRMMRLVSRRLKRQRKPCFKIYSLLKIVMIYLQWVE